MLPSPELRHQCMIYDGPPSRMLPALALTVQKQLAGGARCVYLNSPTMVTGFVSQLYATGTDVHREMSRGALVLDSTTDHLVGGRFDIERMIDALDAATSRAVADGFTGLFATGDVTWEFGPERDFSRLLDYEWRLEQLFRRQPSLSGICQYHRELLPLEAVRDAALSHAQLYISATLCRLNPHYVPALSSEERKLASSVDDNALAAMCAKP